MSSLDELYVTPQDLRYAINPRTLAACFVPEDEGEGIDNEALLSVLRRASDRCRSYLPRAYQLAVAGQPTAEVPAGIKNAAIEYAVCFAHERHPEFVRAFDAGEHARRLARADKQMERIATGAEYLPDNAAEPEPATVGGLVYSQDARVVVDSADGTRNRGDW